MRKYRIVAVIALATLLWQQPAWAQPPAAQQLFDGRTLGGWEGAAGYWSVEDGAITGITTPENPLAHNTFLIWRGGTLRDFQLQLEFRIVQGNSGIQYRSVEKNDFAVAGYQADIDATNRYTGILYEEQGRGILAQRGEHREISADGQSQLVGQTSTENEFIQALVPEQWNQYTIRAEGKRITHQINGISTISLVDGQSDAGREEGILALQLHAGPPMKVQFRNIQLSLLTTADQTAAGEGSSCPCCCQTLCAKSTRCSWRCGCGRRPFLRRR